MQKLMERLGERMLAKFVPQVRAEAAAQGCYWEYAPPCLSRYCCDFVNPPSCSPWQWGC